VEARTPEMQKYLKDMNKDLLDKIEANRIAVTKQYGDLKDQHEKDSHVTLMNGDKRTIKTNEAVAEMHNDLKEIKIAVEPLFDFVTLHRISKKYKLYWLLGLLLSIFFTHNIWQPVLLEMIKKL